MCKAQPGLHHHAEASPAASPINDLLWVATLSDTPPTLALHLLFFNVWHLSPRAGLPNSQRPSHTGGPSQPRASQPGTPRGSAAGSGGSHLIAGLHLHVSVVGVVLQIGVVPYWHQQLGQQLGAKWGEEGWLVCVLHIRRAPCSDGIKPLLRAEMLSEGNRSDGLQHWTAFPCLLCLLLCGGLVPLGLKVSLGASW
eukprot:257373-Pelagomonas_calceolata.AAC.1